MSHQRVFVDAIAEDFHASLRCKQAAPAAPVRRRQRVQKPVEALPHVRI
jgi:hypothetical protein